LFLGYTGLVILPKFPDYLNPYFILQVWNLPIQRCISTEKHNGSNAKHMIAIPRDAIGRQSQDSCVLVQWRHKPKIDVGKRIRILQVYRKLHHKIIASITWLSSSALLVRISKKLDRCSFP
jgi:hypothetical protein